MGWSVEKIKEAGRWASNAYRAYICPERDVRSLPPLS